MLSNVLAADTQDPPGPSDGSEVVRGIPESLDSARAKSMLQVALWAHADERGSGTVLGMAMMLFSWLAVLVVAVTGSWIWQAHSAALTADLVALSGAHALVAGESACLSAKDISESNGAELTACNVVANDAGEFLVKVTVSVPTRPRVPMVFEEVSVQAQAGMLAAR